MDDPLTELGEDFTLLRWLHAEAVHRAGELEQQRDSLAAILERMDTEHTVWRGPDGQEIHPDWCRECRVSALKAAIADIDAHATPVGLLNNDDPDGSPHHYLLTVGALHRALGKAYTAEPCEAERVRLRAERDRERSSRQAWAAEAAELKAAALEARDELVLYRDALARNSIAGPAPEIRGRGIAARKALAIINGYFKAAMSDWPMVDDRRLCACISDDQAANLGPGFTRPVCAVHPEVV